VCVRVCMRADCVFCAPVGCVCVCVHVSLMYTAFLHAHKCVDRTCYAVQNLGTPTCGGGAHLCAAPVMLCCITTAS